MDISSPSLSGQKVITSGSFAAVSLVDITSIPQTYRSLVLNINGASNTVATRGLVVEVSTGVALGGANYGSYQHIIGNTAGNSNASTGLWTFTTQTASQETSCMIQFPDYYSTKLKTFSAKGQLATPAGTWNGTPFVSWGSFVDGSIVPRTGAITGIRMTWNDVSTGVFDGGTYELIGVN